MIITKTISYGTIDVDPDDGKIWINCPNCVLRIQNLRFNIIVEKFSMIDINGVDTFMYAGSSNDDPFTKFMEKNLPVILEKCKDKTYEEIESYLNLVHNKIKELE